MEHDFIKANNVKKLISENGLNCSPSVFHAINEDLYRKIKKSCQRASKNARKTVFDRDY